jgi:hypothetical protein
MRVLHRPSELAAQTACFVAALAQILWSLLIISPQAFGFSGTPGLDWTSGLMLFEPLILVIFFLAAYWQHERMNVSPCRQPQVTQHRYE